MKLAPVPPREADQGDQAFGTRVPRFDICGRGHSRKYVRMQHVRVDMCMAGSLRARAARSVSRRSPRHRHIIDDAAVPSAHVVRKGDFVGVVAPNEWDAVTAAQQLKVTWQETPALPTNLFADMRAANSTDTVIADWGDAQKAFVQAAHVASATYRCPYQSHAPFAPNCALADVGRNGALVLSSTQDIYKSRAMLATVLGLPVDKVRVQYYEGSGTFGRSCYDDAAQAAAVMSQAAGKPVRVQFMRWDELGWDDYGPAHLADVRAGVDAAGKLVAYEYHGWQHGWMVNETTHELALLTPPKEQTSGPPSIPVNRMSTGSMYAVSNRRVVSHAVPMVGYLKGRPCARRLICPSHSLRSRPSMSLPMRSTWIRWSFAGTISATPVGWGCSTPPLTLPGGRRALPPRRSPMLRW